MIKPPYELRCEYLVNPICIDTNKPRFSWILTHEERNQRQIAYQIIISSKRSYSEKEHGNIWDSGKIESEININIEYEGPPLESDKYYFWRVKWWDKNGVESEYSEINIFGTGFLDHSDWKAKWISRKEFIDKKTRKQFQYKSGERGLMGRLKEVHALYLRKEFSISKDIKSAKAYVCGLGYYELSINGQKIGDRILEPAQTDYNKIALYSTYEITKFLKPSNAIGIILGNGRCIELFGFDYPKLILQINIHYQDGSNENVITDDSWRVSYGPILENGIYFGETYDARLEILEWDKPNFNDSTWEKSSVVNGYNLSSQMMQPIQVTKTLEPKNLYSPKPGMYVCDFGQNYTGYIRIKVYGPRGTKIRLRFSELVYEDGTINTATNGGAPSTDTYILKGEGVEIYEPHFTYHGFRYVEITGFPGIPTKDMIKGLFFHSNVPQIGDFYCSNDLINQIHSNIIWGQLSNLMSIPTDCPQRDERQGWMGDAQLTTEEAVYNFDMARFYTKYLRDIKLSQKESGSISDVVPPYWKIYPADPAWAAAYMVLTWFTYWYYDDIRILEEHYDSLKKYVNFLTSISKESIFKLGKYGDWCPPYSIASRKTPVDLTSTWYYYHDTFYLSKIAKILSKDEDFEFYNSKAEEIRNAFNKEFLKGGVYIAHKLAPSDRTLSQTSNVLPLYLNMEPANKHQSIIISLIEAIKNEYDFHFDTGIIGTRYIFDVLTDNGYPEIIYKMVNQKSFPGYGYMIREGATTLWERWEKLEGGGMNSHNHIMLGSVDSWFYRTLAGIKAVEPGWKKIVIKPYIPPDMDYATATINSIHGLISSSWEKIKEMLKYRVIIPIGVTGEIWIPKLSENFEIKEKSNTVWINGKFKSESSEIQYKETTENYVIVTLGSGNFEFLIQNLPILPN
jgi:alpha-L-rhamnosidase